MMPIERFVEKIYYLRFAQVLFSEGAYRVINISKASELTGLTCKTIRYYESIGLVTPAARQGNGYRSYGDRQIQELHFVHRARGQGFTLEECRELLDLYQNQHRHSSEVKKIAENKIKEMNERISTLTRIRDSLTELASSCAGDHRADCPILGALEGGGDCLDS